MKIQRAAHQLSPVEILLEMDKERSAFDQEELKAELTKRNLSKEALAKAYKQKEYVSNTREKRATKSLSLFQQIIIFLIPIPLGPETQSGPEMSSWEDADSFLAEAGYKKILKQKLKLRIAGMAFWTILAFFYYWLFV